MTCNCCVISKRFLLLLGSLNRFYRIKDIILFAFKQVYEPSGQMVEPQTHVIGWSGFALSGMVTYYYYFILFFKSDITFYLMSSLFLIIKFILSQVSLISWKFLLVAESKMFLLIGILGNRTVKYLKAWVCFSFLLTFCFIVSVDQVWKASAQLIY